MKILSSFHASGSLPLLLTPTLLHQEQGENIHEYFAHAIRQAPWGTYPRCAGLVQCDYYFRRECQQHVIIEDLQQVLRRQGVGKLC